ncbi:hypothetical protein Y032_0543g3219 [Ancylostoma ceylanicum]|uniref:Peptidase A2 domain-containing protein n=1 Tax=Ancylostoma ceylanicum TaxID=53326 RepID=A0A016WR87_9BILA|nr:hypothetical protein Y032_0543g3219 [Ancylostoma ceylanicum]
MPIILGSKLLRKLVNFYEERAKNEEYSTTTALLESSLRQIKEAKENLLELYREIQDEHKNCKDYSEKREILAEIHQILEESDLNTSIAEAKDLIAVLTAKLNESKKIHESTEIRPEYPRSRAQKVCAPIKDDPEIVQNIAENTEQNKNCVSLSSFSQTLHSNQNKGGRLALLQEGIAAEAHSENCLGQNNNGRVMQSRAKHTNYRPNYSVVCIFCHKGNHLSTRCRTVSDKRMRRKALREQNRCWKCFSRDHNSFVCQKRDCTLCGQKHHISLCLKKDQPQRNHSNKRGTRDIVPYRPAQRDPRNRGLKSNNNQSDRKEHTSTNVQVCMGTLAKPNLRVESTLSEQLVLMTAEGSIWNARRQQYEKILFLFDSGAQKTAVDEELAEQFGLPRQMTEKCTMSGIGGRVETFESHIVPLKIGSAFGEEIEITVQTRPVITEGFPSVRLEQGDVAFLKANEIFLANTKLRGEQQIPRVLVGLDYYHDLVTYTGAKTPSGLHLAKTVFGHTIYGRGLSSVPQPNSVSYNLTAICEKTEHQVLHEHSRLEGPMQRKRAENCSKYSDEIVHAYGFTSTSLPLKGAATDIAKNYSVATGKLQSPQLQPSALNASRRRPALHAKPPSTPSVRRSYPTSAIRRHLPRPRAALRHLPRQEVDRRITRRKKAKTNDTVYAYSCRSPEYHRRIDDPYRIPNHYPYRTSCGGGGVDPSYACNDTH